MCCGYYLLEENEKFANSLRNLSLHKGRNMGVFDDLNQKYIRLFSPDKDLSK